MIALDLIDTPHPNPCTVPAPPEADAALLASIRKSGVLSAIMLRPAGNRYELVFGYRRVAAARAAGLTEIPATVKPMTDLELLEAQVMENLHRRQMHPVDRWKAVADMLDAGETLAGAAIALGYTEREIRQMERLAALHPKIRQMVIADMPSTYHLKAIAAASHARQIEGLKAQYAVQGDRVNWNIIANACRDATIPRGRAIFDLGSTTIAFTEDLFAQPGADDQFVTRDVAGFMAAQRAALADAVAAHKQRNERVVLADWFRGSVALPRGYTPRFTPARGGSPKGPAGPTKFMAIVESGDDIGKVVEVLADPPAPLPHRMETPGREETDAQEPPHAVPLEADRQDPLEEFGIERPPITNRGRQIIAATKTAALREHIRRHGGNLSAELLGACLVLALAGDNVRISDETSKWAVVSFGDLAMRLVDPAGRLDIDAVAIGPILAEALARMLTVTDPVTLAGSGLPPEWIGNALQADMALPRYDTAEFLGTLAKPELLKIAADLDIAVPDKVTALREALVGKAPGYHPTTFGAPGPRPRELQVQHRPVEESVA